MSFTKLLFVNRKSENYELSTNALKMEYFRDYMCSFI